jgi:hypothetical protein
MELDVQKVTAEAHVHFESDQAWADGPLYEKGVEAFGNAGKFRQMSAGMDEKQGRFWLGENGLLEIAGRPLRIETVLGSRRTLALSADGVESSERLLDALETLRIACRDAYALVGGRISKSSDLQISSLGVVTFRTVAIVRFPRTFEQYVPQASTWAGCLRNRLQARGEEVVAFAPARFRWDVTVRRGGRQVQSEFILEPRTGTKSDERVFFTQSPLPADEHVRLIEELARTRG